MKFKILVSVLIILTIVLSGCSLTDDTQDKFIIWGERLDPELRETLIKRLEDADIDYKLDENNNVLIKEKDMKAATMCCT